MSRFGRRGDRVKRVWVQNVDVNAQLLTTRLDALRARRRVLRRRLERGRRGRSRETAAIMARLDAEDAVDLRARGLIGRAHDAAHRKYPVPNPVVNWWGGRLIEAAYQNLHTAEAVAASLYDWDDLEAEIPEAIARVEAGLQRDDPRREAAHALGETRRGTVPLDAARASLTKAIEVGHAVADREHSRLRSFRNALLAAAVVIALLLLLFGLYVWNDPDRVPLCWTPTPADGETASWVCPTGEEPITKTNENDPPSDKHDILVVFLLGVIGGAFSAAISIRSMPGSPTPYGVPLALAVLKLPLGALTALAALIALQGDFVPGLSELDSQGQILAYALAFGYAQQLLSGLLDRKANALLDAAPGKDKEVHYTPRRTPPPPEPRRRAPGRRADA
ncbi:hypothetical protein [Nocardioides euryhalodurans]|uniref:Uncharacterized protein n=1 Tax=Nocardioides euryhalodurans TaxID=2518370 RepID=A0A4P7GIM3_9ACTN|nr:hypothetical protein [Nocardioides euryhalodurans]QBR91785.1 hypothetical protein EXE57_05490 [Nocardioides euryhalodurans]